VNRQEVIARLRALATAADHHLEDPRARYFDPAHIMDLFTRAASLMEGIRTSFSSALGDLPVRRIPTASPTTDFEGRGYIHRHEIETVRRDLRYCVDVLDALPPAAPGRPKGEKLGILDSPALKAGDLADSLGLLGAALIYLDIDHFKNLNTRHKEVVVDRTVLAQFQQLIADATAGHGFAYAEGGDEVVILLRNFSPDMATAFARDLLDRIRRTQFKVETAAETITVSAGLAVASAAAELPALADHANEAKNNAKQQGRDRLVVWRSPTGA